MVNSSSNHPEVVLIKQDDKFFSRLLAKEKSSKGESSLRFYYYEGSSGSVPFGWESQPGTPKPSFNGASVPPLTPPPSYHSTAADQLVKSMQKPSRKSRFSFPSFFSHKVSSKKTSNDVVFPPNSLWSPSASPSCSSSFSSASAVALTNRHRHRRSRSDVGFDEYGDPVVAGVSPTSTLCFGGGSSKSFRVKKMKRALLSIVGHGH